MNVDNIRKKNTRKIVDTLNLYNFVKEKSRNEFSRLIERKYFNFHDGFRKENFQYP